MQSRRRRQRLKRRTLNDDVDRGREPADDIDPDEYIVVVGSDVPGEFGPERDGHCTGRVGNLDDPGGAFCRYRRVGVLEGDADVGPGRHDACFHGASGRAEPHPLVRPHEPDGCEVRAPIGSGAGEPEIGVGGESFGSSGHTTIVVEGVAVVAATVTKVSTAFDVTAFDPSDAAFQQDPYPVLNAIREATPIFLNERTGQWTVTRFDLVHALLRDRRVGRTYTHLATNEEVGRAAPDARWADFTASETFSLLNLEPPDHTRIRSLLAKVFTPSSVAQMRPHLDALSAALLAAAVERCEIDLLRDYAMPYSIDVICTLLGVPTGDGTQLLRWSHAIVKMYELATTDLQRVEANTAGRDFIGYTRALIAAKRAHPDATLVSELVAVEEAGDRLTEDEIVSTVIVLLNAGHEATVNVHGNGMRAFFRHPNEWQRLRDGEVATRSAVEEMTRWDAPLQLFERFVLARDGIEVAGRHLPFGTEVAMLFGAANRDPRRFVDPERFDAGRNDTGHIGFGGGIHFCIGAPLARLELEVSLEHLRGHTLELVAEPVYAPTFVLHGLEELRVKVSR